MKKTKANINVKFPRSKRVRYGFTLVEMLVVIAIIAIGSSVGVGFYTGTFGRLQVERAARDLLLTAKYGRIKAIEQQRRCKIELDATNGGFWLVVDQLNEETEQTEQTIVRDFYSKPVEFAETVKFEEIQITPIGSEETSEETAIVFLPNGTSQSAVIQIGNGKNHYTVSICAATGRARIYQGTSEQVQIKTIDLDKI
jgi:prepilin-type N-terminal cleavage/methylation domain-containing protein